MTTMTDIEFDYIEVGTTGDDQISGMQGDDLLNGDSGDDTLIGFGGNDLLMGDDFRLDEYLSDQEIFAPGDEAEDYLAILYTAWQSSDVTSLEDYAPYIHDFLFGDIQFPLSLFEGDGGDRIIGGAGNDVIYGGGGDDYIGGGSGNDVMIGVAGNNDMLGGTGDDLVIGGIGNDRLFGNDGNDTLVGTTGNDFYIGGEGNDFFVFYEQFPSESSHDRVVDYTQGEDTIVLLYTGDEFEDLSLTQVGSTVVLELSQTNTVTFNNTQLSDLTEDDFMFSYG
ncbi:calcium-binding protein [Enterovibrio norvegicus]|uniref:calcium-binding protein n=1 Tax=Enterovibrio norvegicus TaxID=188144 RepID=UPI000C8565FA|nr:hypothetical protein [Enterovibrio norvegicus]PML82022.1 hypothetical protein BCT69_01390 [Enterovibrio norvegicus]